MNLNIFEILFTLLLGLIAWILKRQINRIDQLEKDLNSIRLNYLDRFTKVTEKLEAIHLDIAIIKKDVEVNQYVPKRIRALNGNQK